MIVQEKVIERIFIFSINRQKRSMDGVALGRFPRRTSSVVIPLSTQSSSSGHVYPAVETEGFCVPSLAFPKYA